ncbi:MAG: hypothetical protein FJ280_23075 [Planctomycetes bacterium]|nr:hypothetical protein [Planctomycetota bacterium]
METERDNRWIVPVIAVVGMLLLGAAVIAAVLGGRASLAAGDVVALMRLVISASRVQIVGPVIATGIAAGAAILCAVLVPTVTVWVLLSHSSAGRKSKPDR